MLRVVSDILVLRPEGKGTDLSARPGLAAPGDEAADGAPSSSRDFLARGLRGAAAHGAARSHDVVPVVLRDPMEEAFPALGLVEVEDPETGERALVDSSSRCGPPAPSRRRCAPRARRAHPRLPRAGARLRRAARRRGPRRGPGALLPGPRPEAGRVSVLPRWCRWPSWCCSARCGADAGRRAASRARIGHAGASAEPRSRLGEPFVYR